MLMLWIGLGVLALGIVCIVVYKCWWAARDWWMFTGCLSIIVGAILTIVFGIGALSSNIYNEVEYQEKMIKREAIMFRLEHLDTEQNLNVNGGVYDDVVAFNRELLDYKTWTHNPWVGCMWSDKIAEIDYIDLGSADYQNLPSP